MHLNTTLFLRIFKVPLKDVQSFTTSYNLSKGRRLKHYMQTPSNIGQQPARHLYTDGKVSV